VQNILKNSKAIPAIIITIIRILIFILGFVIGGKSLDQLDTGSLVSNPAREIDMI